MTAHSAAKPQLLLTGGTGLIGSALVSALRDEYDITVLSRQPNDAKKQLLGVKDTLSDLNQLNHLDQFDVVINLAGEPIIDKRWTKMQRLKITNSRWLVTKDLVSLMQKSENPPEVFISGSAIGIYGQQQGSDADQLITETFTDHTDDFSHQLCEKWESIAYQAHNEATRVCVLRTGIVLSAKGGALTKMKTPFKFGLGGPIGSGAQFMSWIHIDDMIGGIKHLINHSELSGAFNFTAPNPVTNKAFSKALARRFNRPCVFTVPPLVLKCALGEASELLTLGQNVIPKRLLESGYEFTFDDIHGALADLPL